MENIEENYAKVVDDFIDQYKLKGNIISYNKFLIGCSLFEIGNNLGFEASTLRLIEFMQVAKVQTKTKDEEQNVTRIRWELQQKSKDQKTSGLK